MLDYIECNNAFVFLQAIRKDGKWYFIEMNYRLSGVSAHRAEKSLYGHSLVEKAVSTALNRPYSFNLPETTKRPENTNMGVYFVYANPGIVKEIKGVEELKDADGIQITLSRFKVGDEVKRTDNMLQMAFYIVVWSNSVEETTNRLDKINNTLHITDVNDNEMLIKFKDFDLFDK